jgi:UPF0755 protein
VYFSSSLRKWFLAACILLLLTLATVVWSAWQNLNTPIQQASAGLDYSVEPGASFREIINQLESEGAISNPVGMKIYARLTDKASRIKAGEYQIEGAVTPIELLDILVDGRVRMHQFTIVEGWNFRQLRAALKGADEVLDIRADTLSDEELMDSIGYPGVHPEGRFLPDTYSFPRGTSDIKFLQRAYRSMQDFLNAAWENRDENLATGTPDEVLILASIVEKETAAVEERPLIAAVFTSRLRVNMRLQADPTVIYGLGESFDGNIRRKHLRQDTAYNTYTRHGLTPTPIAMPGREAIEAVLHPAESEALYFVARGDGTHQFSLTLSEHQAAVDKYQRKLRSK